MRGNLLEKAIWGCTVAVFKYAQAETLPLEVLEAQGDSSGRGHTALSSQHDQHLV